MPDEGDNIDVRRSGDDSLLEPRQQVIDLGGPGFRLGIADAAESEEVRFAPVPEFPSIAVVAILG